jgi:hypothetical protein
MITPGPVQTSYNQYVTPGQVGTRASTYGWDVDSRICSDLSGDGIGLGLVVSQSAVSDAAVVIGHLSGGVVIGISVADPTLPNVGVVPVDTYANGDNMGVATRGDWWVEVVGDVAAGGEVYYDTVTGQLGPSGISNAAQLHGATFMTSVPYTDVPSVTMGQLAVVRLSGISERQ